MATAADSAGLTRLWAARYGGDPAWEAKALEVYPDGGGGGGSRYAAFDIAVERIELIDHDLPGRARPVETRAVKPAPRRPVCFVWRLPDGIYRAAARE